MIKKILIADPNKTTGTQLGQTLRQANYHPIVVDLADRVFDVARTEKPVLTLLEANFQEPTGLEICKKLQTDSGTSSIPIIMLSEQAEDLDRILGLEMGAEDYLRKPCHPRELTLKIRKILSRCRQPVPEEGRLQMGEVVLDRNHCEATQQGQRIPFTPMEFKLLFLLVERAGRVQSRERLLRDVWGYDAEINSRTLDVHIRKIRQKLGDHDCYVETAFGFGYRVLVLEKD